jgi:LDH2 family malate/lactate/ureidoglycolate dehydrogenase
MVVPLGGAERKFGTNPIAFAFPTSRQPIVIDMSTSAVPFGKIEMARRRGESIPDGWGVDGDGRPTNDPSEIVAAGALLPLGSDAQHGGHKGSCLAAVVDMLCCVLSGANWGPYVQPFALNQAMPSRQVGKGLGHFFGAMRIDCFIEPDEFRRQADAWIEEIRSTRPAPGSDGPLIPGDPEREAEAARSRSGIPLIGPVVDELRQLSAQTGVPFDQPV